MYADGSALNNDADNISPQHPSQAGQFTQPDHYKGETYGRKQGEQHQESRQWESRAMYSNEESAEPNQMNRESSNMASPRISETSAGGGMLQHHQFVVPGVPAPPPEFHQSEDPTTM